MHPKNEVLDRCLKWKKGLQQEPDRWQPKKISFYDEIDAVLGCRDSVTLRHVLETRDFSTSISSADSDSPQNVSSEFSQDKSPQESVAIPKSRLEKKKGQGKRKRKLENNEDEEKEEHYKRAVQGIRSQGKRVLSCMEKMQEMQMQQIQFMNQFMRNFLQAFKDK